MKKSAQRRTQEEEKPQARTALLGALYFIIIIGGAYALSVVAVEQVNFYQLLGVSRRDVPELAIQIALVVLIGFVLHLLFTIFLALFSGGKKEEDFYGSHQNPWER